MENDILIDSAPVIIEDPAPAIVEDALVITEEIPVANETPIATDPVVVKGFIATRNIKIDGVTTMKGQLIPENIKSESLQVLLDSGYVLSAE